MTEQEYRAAEGVNKSTLWEMRRSPAHYKYILENPPADTQALRFGRALHSALLTPEEYKAGYFIPPEVDKRTKAGKEAYTAWRAVIPVDAEEITAEDARVITEMCASVLANQDAANLLKGTRREVPLFWTDKKEGIRCKCRVDALGEDAVIDIKTTADIMAFERDANSYGYHVQAAHYLRGVEAERGRFLPWYFIAVEKRPPYGVKVFKASSGFIDYGDFVRAELLHRVRECAELGEWPSYSAGEITEPRWINWEE